MNYEQRPLYNADIIITKIEDDGSKIKIEDNKKDYYSFFKNKKEGNPSAAYSTFQQLNVRVGSSVQVAFSLVPYKDKQLRSIVKFKPAGSSPVSSPTMPIPSTPPTTLSAYESIGRFAEKTYPEAWGKMSMAYQKTQIIEDEINVADIPF